MIAAIYARKSTLQDVADDAKSVTRQIDGARRLIASKGWTLDDLDVYTDDGVSGALFDNHFDGGNSAMNAWISRRTSASFVVLNIVVVAILVFAFPVVLLKIACSTSSVCI